MGLRRTPGAGAPSWVDHTGQPGTGGAENWHPAGPVGASTRLQATLSRWLALGLWAVIGLALVLGLVNCAQTSASAPPPVTAAHSPTPVAPPGGCAELAVAAWVAGDADLLDGATAATGLAPDADRQAVHTYTAAVTGPAAPDRWGYLVAARVQERDRDSGQWQDLGLQYFTVTMVESQGGCQGWSPAALPMQVAAPPLAADVALPYTVPLTPSGTELGATLEAFFGGMLAGAGDMERYLAPGVTIPAVVPAPYREIRVTDLRAWSGAPIERAADLPPDGTTVRLLVTVTADRAALPLTYPVTVAVRGGRWEVVAIDPMVAAPPGTSTPGTPAPGPPASGTP